MTDHGNEKHESASTKAWYFVAISALKISLDSGSTLWTTQKTVSSFRTVPESEGLLWQTRVPYLATSGEYQFFFV